MPTPGREFKDAIYEQFARLGKAISSPKRIELLDLLCQGQRGVEQLAAASGLTIANASQHLQVLRRARLVESEKQGVHVLYRLADPSVADFVRSLRLLAEDRLAEVERIVRAFLEGRERFRAVDQDELLRRVRSGKVTVLDVRPSEEFRAGHVPSAVSIPLGELESRLSELPEDREIVAYCRGPYCILAVEAVEILQARGFRAVRLEMGVVDWRARGFEVVVGG